MSEKGEFDENYWRSRCMPPGTVLNQGNYEIVKVLGTGGFGVTYLGRDINLLSDVAIKEYRPQDRESDLNAFLREARTLSDLRHIEGIVKVHSFFQENDTAYIVMDYVEGIDIKDYVIQYGRMSSETVLKMMKRIIAALQKVHECGLIHRDISADNLLVSPEGHLTLIDLGAARCADIMNTSERTALCKAGFTPLEQYSRQGVQGPWTDVYSICATMYYMMTGICPPSATDRVLEDCLAPLSEVSEGEVSDEISHIIKKGMEIDQRYRIQDMAQLYELLYKEALPDTKGDFFERGGMGVASDGESGNGARTRNRTVHSHILSFTQVAHELGVIKEKRNNRRKWFVIKIAAAVLLLCLTGVAGMVFLREAPQAGHTKDGDGMIAAPEPSVSRAAIKPTPVKTSEPTAKPTPKPTKKPTPKPTQKPTKRPTKKPASSRTATPKPASTGGKEPDMVPLPEDDEDLAGDLDDLD